MEVKPMQEGLLWFDNDPRHKLVDKVGQAASRYKNKFGHKPTVCYLNAADFDDQASEVNGIRLRSASNILRYHLWIGVENNERSTQLN
jgi:hypothetical protein